MKYLVLALSALFVSAQSFANCDHCVKTRECHACPKKEHKECGCHKPHERSCGCHKKAEKEEKEEKGA